MTIDDDFEPVIEDLLVMEAGGVGDDTTPLMALVHDSSYSRGTLTSGARTNSEQYLRFLGRKTNERRG